MTKRVGLIIPSSNRMVEQEMFQGFPAGVQAHIARLRMTGPYRGPLEALMPRVEEASATLLDAKCDVVAFHCTANSMQEGTDGEALILKALAKSGAAHGTTTATAIRRALAALGPRRRIVLLTPYTQAVTEHEGEFLAEDGHEVIYAKGFELGSSDAYSSKPATFWRDAALAAANPRADVYFLSCANIAVLGIIDELEAELQKPVITSNQAVIWDALCRLGVSDRRGCQGQLFARSGVVEAVG